MAGAPAMAADMPGSEAQALPVWTWAGTNFGAHAGGALGTTNWTTNAGCFVNVGSLLPHCSPVDQKPGGWVVGGHGGVRWQWGALIFGLEATLAASRIIANDPSACTSAACFAAAVPFFHNETLIQTLYSGTAQVGYAFDRTLFYVKGGLAGGDVRRNITLVPPPPAVIQAVGETRQGRGWTIGAGIECLVLRT
jgi:outer membrane immunogenic protein